jgi:hypothetical protein
MKWIFVGIHFILWPGRQDSCAGVPRCRYSLVQVSRYAADTYRRCFPKGISPESDLLEAAGKFLTRHKILIDSLVRVAPDNDAEKHGRGWLRNRFFFAPNVSVQPPTLPVGGSVWLCRPYASRSSPS